MKEKIYSLIDTNRRILPGVALIGVLALLLLLRWGYNHHSSSLAEITAYNDLLQTSSSIVERGDDVKNLISLEKKKIASLEKGLLKAKKPTIAAAELQESFKKILVKKNISIDSENVLNFEEAGNYIKIPVEFHLKAELKQLTSLLYEIRLSPVLMGIKSLNIRSIAARDQAKMNVTLVLEGAIKNKEGAI